MRLPKYRQIEQRKEVMNARRGLLLAVTILLSSAVNAQPFAFAVNSDDELNADSLLRVNLADGNVEFIGPLPASLKGIEGLALDAGGNLFGVDDVTKSLVRIDPQTGDASPVNNREGNLGFRTSQTLDFGMTFGCNGRLLLVAEQTQSLYEVDTASGQAQVIGQSGGLGDAMTAIASYGANLFALAAGSNNLYQIDAQAGTAALLMSLAGFDIRDAGMAFDADGFLWAVLDGSGLDANSNAMFEPSTILRINISSREVLTVAQTRTGIESLAIGGPGSCEFRDLPPSPAGIATPIAVPSLSQWSLLLLIILLATVGNRYLPLKR